MAKLKANWRRKIAEQILTILMFVVVLSMIVALFAPALLNSTNSN